MNNNNQEEQNLSKANFVRNIIIDDVKNNKHNGKVVLRFPPEPNGYLHIGHAKSICLNFGLAKEFHGSCNLRFDDTNPTKEEEEYIESIKNDVQWLGFGLGEKIFYTSDYFEQLYSFALQLVKAGKAYVEDLTAEEIREYRGTLKEPGKESPYRNRSIEENIDLLEKMKNGDFEDGKHVLRAKIDMASPNINLRDPVLYRIQKAHHHRTGDRWSIYPMYDFAHGQSDSIEGITHSVCTLEFEDHRPLYDWFIEQLGIHHPQQIEFARLNLSYTVMSKRKLLQLVEEKYVEGWDDPRMPTISGLRRRGFTPASIKDFMERIGVAKADSSVDVALLEHCLREDLNKNAPRVMAVLRPLRVVITNYPENQVEELEAENNPEDETAGTRTMPFSKVIYIEQDDFMEDAPKKFFRLSQGREVRLKHAYYVTCNEVIKNENGDIIELQCSYDPATKGGWSDDGRKVKGTLHWVSEQHALKATVRLYDRLFTKANMNKGDFKEFINPDSVEVLENCLLEPSLSTAKAEINYQFLRQGYFCVDSKDSKEGALIFNRSVSLKDSWANQAKK
ncbi:MAG: glutamine--tRNA ligase/YqeY domain fusion protein [Nitrospinae bacterium]|nr:glutamine--tRNA ligase/YqeY domain fusion protein [Nitrospinota bacterium]